MNPGIYSPYIYRIMYDNIVYITFQMMSVNLRGEMIVGISKDVSLLDLSLVEKMAEAMRLSSREVTTAYICIYIDLTQRLNVQTN